MSPRARHVWKQDCGLPCPSYLVGQAGCGWLHHSLVPELTSCRLWRRNGMNGALDRVRSGILIFSLKITNTNSPRFTTITGTGKPVISSYTHKSKHPYDRTFFLIFVALVIKRIMGLQVNSAVVKQTHSSKWAFFFAGNCKKNGKKTKPNDLGNQQKKMLQIVVVWLRNTTSGHKEELVTKLSKCSHVSVGDGISRVTFHEGQ